MNGPKMKKGLRVAYAPDLFRDKYEIQRYKIFLKKASNLLFFIFCLYL